MKTRKEIEKINSSIKRESKNFKQERNRYDLRLQEVIALRESIMNEPFEGIRSAFDYGFIKGMRYYKKHGGKRG
ncbi:hypothetical protein [Anaerotignum sp.]